MLGNRNPDFLAGEVSDQVSDIHLETPEGELHLRFYLPSGAEFALPALGIRETVITSPERVTPIPNVSPLLLGTLNLRGRVIWVADLGQFLGDSQPLNTDRQEIHVIAVEDQDTLLGLAIDRLGEMAWLSPDSVVSAAGLPETIAPFVRGEWVQKSGPARLRLLDQVAIVRSARWAM